jgi:hypothetical protein
MTVELTLRSKRALSRGRHSAAGRDLIKRFNGAILPVF